MHDFKKISLPLRMRTTNVDPVSNFFVPVINQSISYDVAVGFFTSAWIRDAAEGIANFACNNGKARWIISPILSKEDFEMLRSSNHEKNADILENVITKSFDDLFKELKTNTRNVLSWLIHDKIMEFRIAIPKNELTGGMMHAKMGVFRDKYGNRIGWSGSYNLTSAAASNWEAIEIFCDWKSEDSLIRVDEIVNDFDIMWGGYDKNLAIHKPSEKALEPFISQINFTNRPYIIVKEDKTVLHIPARFLENNKLRDYQELAINSWIKSECRGILAMATGAGKTVTALSAATILANKATEKNKKLLIIIAVPYKHLALQWQRDALDFQFKPILCFDNISSWLPDAELEIMKLSAGIINFAMMITVNNTLCKDTFQDLLNRSVSEKLLIADEMHNLGSPEFRKSLNRNINLRLGLSATPIRHGDEDGTQILREYFGETVYEYTLQQAIDSGQLCKYYYYPILCPLNDEEMEKYSTLTNKISRLYAINRNDDEHENTIAKLLIERARLISMIESKTKYLEELLSNRQDSKFNLIYCGDASDTNEKQINKIIALLGNKLKMRANKITAEETPQERKLILNQFADGELQALVAIKCLDEGVDIPRTETAYILSSSTNPRQYIQRRGRVLRKSKGKQFAKIYDFIAIPDLLKVPNLSTKAFGVERSLIKRELDRINNFSNLALNYGEANQVLSDIRKKYQLIGA